MMRYWLKCIGLLSIPTALIFLSGSCSKKSSGSVTQPPAPVTEISSIINIDRSQKYQTIDGFGFFGAKDVWWGNAANLYSDAWATQVINDLGITIWRTELNPPATATAPQDADWAKQKPTIEGLKKIADANRIPLKFIFTVWSPPADLKCAVDANDNAWPGTPNPGETKNGGTLNPDKYTAFGNWLADGIQLFKDAGIDVYAVSPQNEPLFKQFFNSCFYRPVDQYPAMIKNVIPVLKSRFPLVKVFGSENMLEMEGGKDRQYFYNAHLVTDAAAISNIDILAVHGYSDGVSPSSSSKLAQLWNTTQTEHAVPAGKPYWMTETSGYTDSWKGTADKPSGALNLAMDIHAALNHGNVSAWVWWQGSNANGIDEFSLMKGIETKGKKYYASKHFYRFIRPGAVRIKLTSDETLGVFATAYENTAMGSFTIVLINNSDKQVKLNLTGDNVPDKFDYYITSASADENCVKKSTQASKNDVVLPAYSVVTLVNGNVFE
jgi:glucuronoarabinoxylan endo-1,4-beta-xylanase